MTPRLYKSHLLSTSLLTGTLCAFLLSSAHSFIFTPGHCPRVPAVTNFDIEKFLGTWYIVEKFRAPTECLIEDIIAVNGSYFIFRNLKPMGVPLLQKGKLSFLPSEASSRMTISFPALAPGTQEDYRVLMTDYHSYAAVWSCQRIMFSNRQSAQIMARETPLNETIIQQIKRLFRSYGIDDRNFFKIDHSKCGDPDDGLERPDTIEEK